MNKILGSFCSYTTMPEAIVPYPIIPGSLASSAGCAIVAVAGDNQDWAAYIGSFIEPPSEQALIDAVAQWGNKLPKQMAQAIFPEIKLAWRE